MEEDFTVVQRAVATKRFLSRPTQVLQWLEKSHAAPRGPAEVGALRFSQRDQ